MMKHRTRDYCTNAEQEIILVDSSNIHASALLPH